MQLIKEAKKLYRQEFGRGDLRYFFSHGRLEILGNHTDHQGGVCIVGGVDLGITAAVCPNKDGAIRVVSEGFAPFMFHLDELALKKGEAGTTISIFKGVLHYLKKYGYEIGGFSCALKSDLPHGSGLSSSAALETLVCEIQSALYNKGKVKDFDAAKISQKAGNDFFGKPCGLLDQVGTQYGGLRYLDFSGDIKIERIPYDLTLKVVVINPGSSHADLTDAYASIPADMTSVAKNLLGVERLCESDAKTYSEAVVRPCQAVSERAKLRAQHYYDECKRVEDAKKALLEKDPETFLQCIRLSQNSSNAFLANTFLPGRYEKSPQEAVDVANKFIGHGACRIMGGGFAGSIICFLYPTELDAFLQGVESVYGKENVHLVNFVNGGPTEVGF